MIHLMASATLIRCFTPPSTQSHVVAVAPLEAAYEAATPYTQRLGLRTSAAS